MATLEYLEGEGVLIRHQPDLDHGEMPERFVSYPPDFEQWLETVLKTVPKLRDRNLFPYDQVEQAFYEFAIGRPMAYDVHYKKLDPLLQHIWEFKTEDVRIFGWFPRKRHFLAIGGELKKNLLKKSLYAPHVENVRLFRLNLDLDEPKATQGVTQNEVL